MKAIGFAGSGRKEGNSTTLLRELLAGAAEAGAETELVFLCDLNYRGCLGCLSCMSTGECVQDDDVRELYPKLREARLWAFASPIYFDGVSGLAKSMFDRLYPFTHPVGKLTGRRAGVVLVTYEDRSRDDYRDVADRLANYLGWMGDFVTEVVAESGLGPVGAVTQRPEALARVRDLGRRMAEALQ
ncbi:MAG: flavodoxin family protein [Armatimonadota bacterium]